MIIIHNLTNKFTGTHIVVQYIAANPRLDRRYNKFIATTTHIVVKTLYTELIKMGYPDKIQKRSGYKPFCPVSEFDIPYFIPISNCPKIRK